MIALKLLCYLQQWQQLKQHHQSFFLAGVLVLGLTVAGILQDFDSEEREMVYYCNASHPLGFKSSIHTDWLLSYGGQCRCVDSLPSKIKLSGKVSSWHCAHLWLALLPCLSFLFVQWLKKNVQDNYIFIAGHGQNNQQVWDLFVLWNIYLLVCKAILGC